MRFEEHPTWRMLEEGKNYFRYLAETATSFDLAEVASDASNSLHSLQIEVENQLITDSRDTDE
jgi:hypothetical protein